MLAQDIDFHEIFRISPTAMALLTADLVFIDANDEFIEESGRPLEKLIGHYFFEEFPKMYPGTGRRNALEEAMTSGRRASDLLFKYDIEEPGLPGVYRERYWCAVVQPVYGADGELEVIELSVRNITPIVSQLQAMQADADAL
jgi:PAS domain-containing protein